MIFLEQFRLLRPGIQDILEMALVAYLIYRLLLLVHGTRAVQMLLGIVVLVFAYAVAMLSGLRMITFLFVWLFTYGPFAALIIFAPELRAALTHLGQSPVTRFFKRLGVSEVADEIAEAIERLSRSGIGAIVAVERENPLGDYVQSGTPMQAKVSSDLLRTIFTPYSPLHDGAVIIRGDSIIGAGAILPLSQAYITDRSLGTRHRAALGLSEETDALVVLVSEETSTISIAQSGRLYRHLTAAQVRDMLAGRIPRTTADNPIIEVRA